MVTKAHNWHDGAVLAEHSRRKHKVLREYVARYLHVRSQVPYQGRFRLAYVDGFAGGGRYAGGESGSPLIFLEELSRAATEINLTRSDGGLRQLEIQCLLVLNDADPIAVAQLKRRVEPLRAAMGPHVEVEVEYAQQEFERFYPSVKRLLAARGYKNVLFNLDQYGSSHVTSDTLRDIVASFPSAEIFFTFAIKSLLAFLKKNDPAGLQRQLSHLRPHGSRLSDFNEGMNTKEWLGTAERIVFDAFRSCAPFVSPFSINNPGGWRYWLIHLAKSYRARQVYNNVLHANSSVQAHFGRSGLDMLHYDPRFDRRLYLFDKEDRAAARSQLLDDIPRALSTLDDGLSMASFYERIYNITPAHADDINGALIDNPDVVVATPNGGERRVGRSIRADDTVGLRRQRSFFALLRSMGSRG